MKKILALLSAFVFLFTLTSNSHAAQQAKRINIYMDTYGEVAKLSFLQEMPLEHNLMQSNSLLKGNVTTYDFTPEENGTDYLLITFHGGVWRVLLNEATLKTVLRDSYPPANATPETYPPGTLDVGALIAHGECIIPSPDLGAHWSY